MAARKLSVSFKIRPLPAHSTPSFSRPLPDSLGIIFDFFFLIRRKRSFFFFKCTFFFRSRKLGVSFKIRRLPAHSTPSFARPLHDSLGTRCDMFFYVLSIGAFFWT